MKLNKENLIKALDVSPNEVLQQWNTATVQADSLERAYKRGYSDGLKKAGTRKKEGANFDIRRTKESEQHLRHDNW